MLPSLLKIGRKSFCLNNRLNRVYDITYQIKDVTMIRGMNS